MASKLRMVTNNRYASTCVIDGRAPIEGFDVEFLPTPNISSMFNEFVQKLSYDIVDLPLSNYLIARDLGKPIVAVPAFPTYFFPQLGPMVNRQAGIRSVGDLVGKRVGLTGFGFNPATWLRGIFFHQYDLPIEQITWVEGEPNSMSGVPFPRSRRFTIEKAGALMPLLEEGGIDALIMADGGVAPTGKIDRLFPDYLAEIRNFLDYAGFFPMNSVLAVKEEALQANPGLAESLAAAYRRAWELYAAEAADDGQHMGVGVSALRQMELFAPPNGLQGNRKALRAMIHSCYEQGLIRSLYEPEELFVPAD